jgi:hypothetical protein
MSKDMDLAPNFSDEELNDFLEAFDERPDYEVSALDVAYMDPADILVSKWIPYTLEELKPATLEDFPEKLEVGFTVKCL